MNTILTDDALIDAIRKAGLRVIGPHKILARAVEAAVLAKLAQQADRQRVPDGVLAAIYRAGFSLVKTADAYELMRLGKVEAQVAAPEAPAQEKSNG